MKTDHVDYILAQWQTLKPELDSSPVGIVGRISRIEKIMRPQIQAGFSSYDITSIEFDILATLRRNNTALTPTQLYQSAMLSSGAMTTNLDKLENRGLVLRQSNAQDRRSCTISLTEQGVELIDRAYIDHLKNEEQMLKPLSVDERVQLASLLQRWLAENESED
jgi:DNA-binding MarR family transcriptional regulator